jgi:hypothetical protein
MFFFLSEGALRVATITTASIKQNHNKKMWFSIQGPFFALEIHVFTAYTDVRVLLEVQLY